MRAAGADGPRHFIACSTKRGALTGTYVSARTAGIRGSSPFDPRSSTSDSGKTRPDSHLHTSPLVSASSIVSGLAVHRERGCSSCRQVPTSHGRHSCRAATVGSAPGRQCQRHIDGTLGGFGRLRIVGDPLTSSSVTGRIPQLRPRCLATAEPQLDPVESWASCREADLQLAGCCASTLFSLLRRAL